eukprot:NODE_6689_length_855_cov_26.245902_g6091_i0.p1 GENE.NODE_6689_length_855_cov_26.245902_g6091_i0~~NODE_6689_length_855_cov_26.245902_g6091_i0.p1  ORF type:complete len:173 (-),score=30.24 NODE_6689_length_855_cov_26.245902_g6091_i0:226-744(-)
MFKNGETKVNQNSDVVNQNFGRSTINGKSIRSNPTLWPSQDIHINQLKHNLQLQRKEELDKQVKANEELKRLKVQKEAQETETYMKSLKNWQRQSELEKVKNHERKKQNLKSMLKAAEEEIERRKVAEKEEHGNSYEIWGQFYDPSRPEVTHTKRVVDRSKFHPSSSQIILL